MKDQNNRTEEKMRKRIALIGYGYWGKKLFLYLMERFDVVCIFGRSLKKEGIFTNKMEDVFANEIDAVVIATPIDTHYEIVKRALKMGKHVMCEKPLAMCSAEIKDLLELAKKEKLILTTDFTYTFSRGLNYIEKLIDKNDIGKLVAMELSLKRVGRFLKFDVYWLLASHMLAVLDMFVLLDNLVFKKIEIIRKETGIILFDGQIKGQIFVSINYPHCDSKITFYGTRGTLIYNATELPTVSIIQYDRKVNELIIGKKEVQYDESNNLRYAVNYFANMLEVGEIQRENLERAFRVTNILEMI